MAKTSVQHGFKIVPESLSDITADWCEKALQTNSTISNETQVTKVEVKQINNEETGDSDGGGFSGSMLKKLILSYGGNVTGNEPSSVICKISANIKRDLTFFFRGIGYLIDGGNIDDEINRTEVMFYEKIAPLLKETQFQMPKSYFVGMEDGGKSGFYHYVIQNKVSKIKSVLILEDLSSLKSFPACVSFTSQEMIAALKNIAVMHGKLWGNKEIFDIFGACKSERDNRSYRYNRMAKFKRKRYCKNSNSFKKFSDKISSSEWPENIMMRLPKNVDKPDWLTIEPLEDGSYVVMNDPMVKEMLSTLENRMPIYFQKKLKPFSKMEPQTILHGDFHSGNHMYGTSDNEGKITAIDFQLVGSGIVIFEVISLVLFSWRIHNYDEIKDFAKEYHNALVENGINDYSWAEFQDHLEIASVEVALNLMDVQASMKPKTFSDWMGKFAGKEKAEGMIKIFETGIFNGAILFLTSLYVKDKENFLAILEDGK